MKKVKILKKDYLSNKVKMRHESKGISNAIPALKKKIIVIFCSSWMFCY